MHGRKCEGTKGLQGRRSPHANVSALTPRESRESLHPDAGVGFQEAMSCSDPNWELRMLETCSARGLRDYLLLDILGPSVWIKALRMNGLGKGPDSTV